MFRVVRYLSAAALIAALTTTTGFAQVIDAARVGAIRLSYVAATSRAGKAALAQLQELGRKKSIEVEARAADLQKQETELQKTAAMSPRAVADLQRAFERSRLDFDRFQQDAKAEVEAMQIKFDTEFQAKVAPIVDAVSKEKGLHFVFGIEQAAIIWWSPAADISDEVVKRLDAMK